MPFKVGQVRAHVGCVKLTVNVDCLTKNKYNEAKCQTAINALYECCDAFYRRYGNDASTTSCPKPDLLQLKLKQQREGQ